MERHRLRDGLVGAGVAVLVIAALLVVAFLLLTRPATDDQALAPSPGTPSPSPSGPPAPLSDAPPTDLSGGDLWLGRLDLEAGVLATPDGVVHDVVVTGHDVRTGADGLVAGRLAVEATVPFELVAGQIAGDVVVGPVEGEPDQAAVHREFEVVGGRVVDVEATGTVLVRAGRLVIEPRRIDIGGPAFLGDLFGALARELTTIEHEIEGLPDGLVLLDVMVQDDGFRANLGGSDVRIPPEGVSLGG